MTTIRSGAAADRERPGRTGLGRLPGRAAGAAAAVLTVLAMSGCSAGQQAQTSREVTSVPGAEARAGAVALEDLLVPYRSQGYPRGSDVPLVVRIFSDASQPVTLSGVLPGAPAPFTVQARSVAARGEPAGSALTVPADGYLELVPGQGPYLLAEHIAAPLGYGGAVPVRFLFSTGASVTVDIPMAPPTYPVSASPTRATKR